MKKLITAAAAATMLIMPALADEAKIGIILGYTGPIESLTPDMAAGAELAISEVNAAGNFMKGMKVTSVRADSTCIDSAAATAAAERLVTADKVNAMVGADCSGVTTAILQRLLLQMALSWYRPQPHHQLCQQSKIMICSSGQHLLMLVKVKSLQKS